MTLFQQTNLADRLVALE